MFTQIADQITVEHEAAKAPTVTPADLEAMRSRLAGSRRPIAPEDVISATLEAMRVDPADFFTRCRHRRVVNARRIAARISRELTTASYPEIAAAMRRPTHSTVIAAVRRLAETMHEPIDWDASSPTVGEMYERVRAVLVERRGAA